MNKNKGDDSMATSTFLKDIYIDDKAADIIIKGLEKPREKHVSKIDIDEELKKGRELLQLLISRSET